MAKPPSTQTNRATQAKPATEQTEKFQQAVENSLPFTDRTSFSNAERGFIASIDPLTISRPQGAPVYDLTACDFLSDQAPATVNPSLWRQAQLNAQHHGLFEVVPGIYQVRSFDLANMTVVKGDTGWIVIDPLTASETAAAALQLVNDTLGERPVTGIIYTHSHVDHFAGALGITNASDAAANNLPIIAPQEFVHEALSENVLAGNVMGRRATYMYGNLLAPGTRGFVSCGLGARLALGSTGFLPPNDIINRSGERRTVDGIDIEFQLTMGTEAPAEMVFYFPAFKALCMSEITSHHLHNVYTPRGAQVRDALAWGAQIQEAIDRFGSDLEVQFASHHWPTWGREAAIHYLTQQRDLYLYLHDQTLRLANHGATAEEIADVLDLPPSLGQDFANRGYYGTVHHNVRAIYVKYLGFFNGNPTSLAPLPPVEAAGHYLEFMGGAEAVFGKAQESFAKGEYRWVCEVLNHVIMGDDAASEVYTAAVALAADALEQLGYQAESAPWRNFYLSGALELRNGVPGGSSYKPTPGMLLGMPMQSFFQAQAVRVNGPKAAQANVSIGLELTDLNEHYYLSLHNAVLHAFDAQQAAGLELKQPKLQLKLPSLGFKNLMVGNQDITSLVATGDAGVSGDMDQLTQLLDLLDHFPRRFPIMTPRPAQLI